jgi:hypothetical protein
MLKKLLFLMLVQISLFSYSQEDSLPVKSDSLNFRKDAPNLFFDCPFCTEMYYKQEINFVNFVRDRRLADIYLMITVNQSANGGQVYKLFFVGEKKFKNQNDTLQAETTANLPDAEIRATILEKVKLGLLRYIVQTRLLDKISYSVEAPENSLDAGKVKDKWNFWTFNMNANMWGEGNSYQKYMGMNYFFGANRTTEKLKVSSGTWYNLNTQEFKIDDTTVVKGLQKNSGAFHYMAFSVGKHFAAGHFATFFKSTQSNLNYSVSLYPTIEYNLFPYSVASRRQLRFIYRAGVRNQDYSERTIYNQTNEWYVLHSLVFQYTQIEKWGNVEISAGTWHYFNYSKNYNVSIYPSINFNPLRGLRVGLWGGFRIVNDQFFLRATDASAAEILLNQVQLKTDYNYNFGFNIGYTFGSRYNSIINVRFDFNDNYL